MRVLETDVLVAGGGPTGLSAGLLLGRLGVRSLVLERRATTSTHPKATIVNTRTMELVRQWGLEDDLRSRGMPVDEGATFVWLTRVAGLPIGELDLAADPVRLTALLTRSPTVPAVCPQSEIEPLLRDAAVTAGADVRFGHEVSEIEHDDDGVTAAVDGPGGERLLVRARYLIGADGPQSLVRRAIGAELEGDPRLADVVNIHFSADLTPWLGDEPRVLLWVVNRDVRGVVHALDGRSQWLLNAVTGLDGAAVSPLSGSGDWSALVRAAIGTPDVPFEVLSAKPWAMTALMADTWRDGCVFLAGDAAHQMPPTGGLGMNTGIQDVHNLCWKLAAVLRGEVPERLLDTYEAERRPVATANLEQSVENAAMMRDHLFGLSEQDLDELERPGVRGDGVRRRLADGIEPQRPHFDYPGLDLGFAYGEAGPGAAPVMEYEPRAEPGFRAPHAWLAHDGAELSTLDLFDDRLVLLTTAEGADAWRRAAERLGCALRVVAIGDDVEDLYGEAVDLYGLTPGAAVLVRPDGHVAWRTDPVGDPAGALAEAWEHHAGIASHQEVPT